MTKSCTICKTEKPLTDYYGNPNTKDKKGSQCKDCDTQLKVQRRRRRKEEFVALLGGKCKICGYNKNTYALDFHHKDGANKEKQISDMLTRDVTRIKDEVLKCELLCCRCHRELHHP